MARPTKFGPHVLEAFKAVLNKENNVLCLTDEDLFFELNDQLETHQQISYRTFQRYKALVQHYGIDDGFPNSDDYRYSEYYDPVYQELYKLFRRALILQKRELMKKMLEDDKNWRKWQWILERKFREWNVRWNTMDAVQVRNLDLNEEELLQPKTEFFDQEFVPVYIDPQGFARNKQGEPLPPNAELFGLEKVKMYDKHGNVVRE